MEEEGLILSHISLPKSRFLVFRSFLPFLQFWCSFSLFLFLRIFSGSIFGFGRCWARFWCSTTELVSRMVVLGLGFLRLCFRKLTACDCCDFFGEFVSFGSGSRGFVLFFELGLRQAGLELGIAIWVAEGFEFWLFWGSLMSIVWDEFLMFRLEVCCLIKWSN